jgi:hypothetical protein
LRVHSHCFCAAFKVKITPELSGGTGSAGKNGVYLMRKLALASVAVLAALGFASAAQAGGGCSSGNCYRQVVTPPVYQSIDEHVLVAPARTRKHRRPALLQDVTEEVVVRPERSVARHIPAEYGVVHERVMTSSGGKRWVMKHDAHGNLVGCWVKTHPTYATVARHVMVRRAQVVHDVMPAVVRTRTRTVVLEPARTEVEHIPAQYGSRTRTVKVSDGGSAWVPLSGGRSCKARGLFKAGCN